jgi:hypothetical protein
MGTTNFDAVAAGLNSTAVKGFFYTTFALDPASVNASTCTEQQVTLTGVAAGDAIFLMPPASLNTGLAYSGVRISAADTIQVGIANLTAGAINDTSRTWECFWFDLT